MAAAADVWQRLRKCQQQSELVVIVSMRERPIQAIAYRVLTSQPQRTQTREKLIAIVQMACWAAPFPLAQSAPAQGIDKAVDWASRIESVVAQGRNLAAGSRPVVAHRHQGTHDMVGVRRSGAHD